MAPLCPNSAISAKLGKHTWQMKYHTSVSRAREHDQKVLDVLSGGVSLAHIAHGVCNTTKHAASPGWLDPTKVGQMASPQPERDLWDHSLHSPPLHSPPLHSIISSHPFHPGGAQVPPTFRLGPTLLPLTSLPLQSLIRSSSLFSPQEGVPTSTRRKFWQSRLTSGRSHWLLSMWIYPGVLQPPTLTPFWWTVDSRWCLATLMPTIPPGSPEQEMIGQRPEVKRLMGPYTVRSSMLQTKISLLTSPPDITLLSGHLLPDVTWSTLTSLGTYHAPSHNRLPL